MAYDMDKLVSYNDGQVLPLNLENPNLLFVSASRVKEPEFKYQIGDPSPENPPEFSYPRAVIERMGSLGTFLQLVSNFKVWFDVSQVSVNDARLGLGSVYGKSVLNDLAVEQYLKVAETRNDDPDIHFKIALEYWYLQNIPKTT